MLESYSYWVHKPTCKDNRYPTFQDENNLSVVTVIECWGFKIVFPGDLETAGWQELPKQQHFRSALGGSNVFVASHHGRTSGVCPAALDSCGYGFPKIVVMSDRDKQFNSQETTDWYGRRVQGIQHGGRNRQVFTTRSDGNIQINVRKNSGDGGAAYSQAKVPTSCTAKVRSQRLLAARVDRRRFSNWPTARVPPLGGRENPRSNIRTIRAVESAGSEMRTMAL